jgi:hypothetical protein
MKKPSPATAAAVAPSTTTWAPSWHTRATSEALASLVPKARLVEPPWGDREWIERQGEREKLGGIFVRWPLLAPALQSWASRELG